MQNNTKRKKLIISLVLSLILLLVCAAGITYAWLTRITSIAASNPNFQILAPDTVVRDYKVYRYEYETNTVTEASITTTTDTSISEDDLAYSFYEMPQYDSIFTERNVYNQLLFVINLDDITSTTAIVNVYCDPNHNQTTTIGPYISNIVQFKAISSGYISNYVSSHSESFDGMTFTTDPQSDTERMQMYDAASKYFKYQYETDNGVTKKFCTATESGNSYTYSGKVTNIQFDMQLTAEEIADEQATIYLLVDYAEDLISANMDANSYSDTSLFVNNQAVTYKNDLTIIYFANPKK